MENLVSIVMPVYNTVQFVELALTSVVEQTYQEWELIVVNDGSTDKSAEILESWAARDARIKVVHQQNGGVSKARNVGLSRARGKFLCFLDSDDWLPPNSLKTRVRKFGESDSVDFVDGHVNIFSEDGSRIERNWRPNFQGNPHNMLLRLSSRCFFGPTWMLRLNRDQIIKFDEGLKHGEDLLFYIKASENGRDYDYVDEVVYCYRNRVDSAMKNADGLAEGYLTLRRILADAGKFKLSDRIIFEYKIRKIMLLTYIRSGNIAKALQYLVR